MKTRLLFVFFLFLSPQVVASEATWTLKEGYGLGSSFVSQDGTALLAEAHRGGYHSTLYMKKEGNVVHTWQVPDLRVNAVRFTRGGKGRNQTILVGGSTGSGHASRLYQVTARGDLIKRWDSLQLGQDYEDAEVLISNDGNVWVAAWYLDQTARIEVGSTDAYDSFMDWELRRESPFPGDLMNSGTVVLDGDRETISVALLWSGNLQVLSKNSAPGQLLPPAGYEVSGLAYHEETQILWATASYGRIAGFSFANRGRRSQTPVQADYEIDPVELGIGGITELFPREDGKLVLHTQKMEGDAIYVLNRPMVKHPQPQMLTAVERGTLLSGWGLIRKVPSPQGNGYRVHISPAAPGP